MQPGFCVSKNLGSYKSFNTVIRFKRHKMQMMIRLQHLSKGK